MRFIPEQKTGKLATMFGGTNGMEYRIDGGAIPTVKDDPDPLIYQGGALVRRI